MNILDGNDHQESNLQDPSVHQAAASGLLKDTQKGVILESSMPFNRVKYEDPYEAKENRVNGCPLMLVL